MKLTTEWCRSLRGAAVVVLVACALMWSSGAANASLINLTATGSHTTATAAAISWAPVPSGTYDAGQTSTMVLTATPSTSFPSTIQLTSTVQVDDPNNPYVNGAISSNINALTFVFQISDSNTLNGLGLLTLDGFGGFGIQYGNYTAPSSGWLSPTPLVQNTGTPTVIDVFFAASSFKASGVNPAVSVELALYTNATKYTTVLDPVTYGGSAIYSNLAYRPTPEPSSLILASIGITFLLGLGWRRQRA